MADSNEDSLETGPFFGAGFLAAIESADEDATDDATTFPVNAEGVTKAHAETMEARATAISIFMIAQGIEEFTTRNGSEDGEPG